MTVVGAAWCIGLEYRLRPELDGRIEYNHLFMQDRTHTFVDGAGAFFGTDRISQDVDLSPSASTIAGVDL